jgi:hypothetical protein
MIADRSTVSVLYCGSQYPQETGLNAGSGKEKWSIHIRPHCASSEVAIVDSPEGQSRHAFNNGLEALNG